MGIFVFQISFLFHRQQKTSTNKFRKGFSYVSGCALEETYDIDKYQHKLWNLPMHNFE